jgi:dihydroorotase
MQRRQFLHGICAAAVLPSCTQKSYIDYAPPHYDLLIKSGEIHDPANGIHRRADIGVAEGKIAAIADDIPASTANDVIEARGLHVTPGLIDLHTHCAFATSPYTIEADPIAARSGVTTWVDAGSVPAEQVAAFRRFVVQPAQARIYAFLYMYGAVKNPDIDIVQYVRGCIESTGEAVVNNRDILLGVKFQAGINMNGKHSLELLKIARETCDRYKLPLMVHIGFTPPETDEVMPLMHSGDVVTHCFNGNSMGILDASGKIKSSVKDAHARGVLFDLGHGWTSFSFDVARKALDAGFAPDTISTDLHPLNVNGPVFDLPTTMSKMMYLGMNFDDVLLRTTANSARIINRVPMSGTLQEGAPADIALLAIEDGKFPLMESKHWNGVDAPRDGQVVTADRRISSRLTICRGKRLTAA